MTNTTDTNEANKAVNKPSKRPDAAAIRGHLFEGNFGQLKVDDALPISDPISTTQMVLKLCEIKPYDKNPRRLINPEYSIIKASIRNQRGLNNPFNVTRRPGDELFMVQSGGNTRLRILSELYRETQDEAFNTVQCLFIPWTSESYILTAHLVENEMRGEMALIDKAHAIKELRLQLEQEQGRAIPDREFIKVIIELGYKLSTRQLRRLNYAVELDQIIPQMMQEGVTSRLLDTIRNTEKAYQQYCEGKTDKVPEIFERNMTKHDGEYFDFDRVRNDIDQELSQILNIPYNRLSLQVDVIINECSSKLNAIEFLADPIDDDEYPDDEPIQFQPNPTFATPQTNNQNHRPVLAERQQPNTQNLTAKATSHPPSEKNIIKLPDRNAGCFDLPSLQQRGFSLATQIARTVNLEHMVKQRPDGLGFVVESPGNFPQNPLKLDTLELLIGLAGQPHQKLPQFPYQLLIDPASLNDPVFNVVVKLIENCRKIKGQFSTAALFPENTHSGE
ncbi:MAG: ParB family protein [Methylococcales bacterium]